MNPRDFLESADDLLEGTREADWRTAIGRAYYAAFLVGAELLRESGFVVPADQGGHNYVYVRLNNCGHQDVSDTAMCLRDLRSNRNVVDYNMVPTVELDHAIQLVEQAREVIRTLDDLADREAVQARVVEAIRVYERDVLKVVTFRASP